MWQIIGEYFIPICERLGQNKKKYFSSIPHRLGKNIVAPIRRLLFNFLKYFIDHSAVNLIIIKYLFINGGTLFPRNCQIGAKIILDIKNIAIMWQLYWRIIYSNFKKIGIKFFPMSSIIIPLLRQNFFSNVKYNNSSSFATNCSPSSPPFFYYFHIILLII